MEVVVDCAARFCLSSLIFCCHFLNSDTPAGEKLATLPIAVLPCCLLAVLPEPWLQCAMGAGGCRISRLSAPSKDRNIHHTSSCQGAALLTLAPQLKSRLFLLYPLLHLPALCDPRATALVTMGRCVALVGSLHKQHKAPGRSLRCLRRGLVSTVSVPMPCFSSTWSCPTSLGLLGMPRGRARVSGVSSSELGDPRGAGTAWTMVRSISSAKLAGYHLQSPDVFITPVGKVNLPHRKVFLRLWVCCGQQEQWSREQWAQRGSAAPSGLGSVKPSGRHVWPVLTFPLARQLTEG